MQSYVEIILSVKLARCNYVQLPRELNKYMYVWNDFNKFTGTYIPVFATSSKCFYMPSDRMYELLHWARTGFMP